MKWDYNSEDAESLAFKWASDFFNQGSYTLGWEYLVKIAGVLGADTPEYKRIRQERICR